MAYIKSWEDCHELAQTRKRKLQNNTYLQLDGGDVYSIRLHSTDIITYYPDGRVLIRTGGYGTVTTMDRINTYSPTRVFSGGARCRFQCTKRFGHWNGDNYPFEGHVVFNQRTGELPDGPLIDTHRIINPALLAKRRTIAKQFRARALPRMMLGEFGDVWAEQETSSRKLGWGRWTKAGDWFARVPDRFNIDGVAKLLLNNESHPGMQRIGERLTRGRPAKSKEDAVRVACEQILQDGLLSGSEWYKVVKTKYTKVVL